METSSKVLTVLTALCVGYIGEFEYVDDHRGGKIVVELNGRSVSTDCVCHCHHAGVPIPFVKGGLNRKLFLCWKTSSLFRPFQ